MILNKPDKCKIIRIALEKCYTNYPNFDYNNSPLTVMLYQTVVMGTFINCARILTEVSAIYIAQKNIINNVADAHNIIKNSKHTSITDIKNDYLRDYPSHIQQLVNMEIFTPDSNLLYMEIYVHKQILDIFDREIINLANAIRERPWLSNMMTISHQAGDDYITSNF